MNWPSRPLRAWPASHDNKKDKGRSMAGSQKTPVEPIDSRFVRKLADILTDTGLSEIEVEHAGLKIRVARNLASVHHVAAPATVMHAAPAAAAPAAAPAAAASPAADAPAARARGDEVGDEDLLEHRPTR